MLIACIISLIPPGLKKKKYHSNPAGCSALGRSLVVTETRGRRTLGSTKCNFCSCPGLLLLGGKLGPPWATVSRSVPQSPVLPLRNEQGQAQNEGPPCPHQNGSFWETEAGHEDSVEENPSGRAENEIPQPTQASNKQNPNQKVNKQEMSGAM